MRRANAVNRLRRAYVRCGYDVLELRLRWEFPVWVVEATILGKPNDTTTGISRAFTSWHDALTKRQLVEKVEAIYQPAEVHDTPATWSDERVHVLDRTCWCKPEVMRTPSGDDLIVHNEIYEATS